MIPIASRRTRASRRALGAILWFTLLAACGPSTDGDGRKARIASLDAKDWRSRVDKVDVLAEARSKESLALLIRAMHDEHPRVREAAIKALAVREDRTAIPSFAQAVKDPDEGVRVAAVAALQRFTGDQAVQVVLLRVGAGSDRERQAVSAGVAAQLARSAPAARLAALRRLAVMVKAERPQTQQDAAAILVKVGALAVHPVLDTLAAVRPGSEGPWQGQLAEVLVRIGAPAVAPLLAALQRAGAQEARAQAAVGPLARIGLPAVPALLELLDARKGHPWAAAELAEQALVRIGAPAVPVLVTWLKDAAPDRRRVAAELLQQIRGPTAAPALVALIAKESDRALRLVAVRALGQQGDPKTASALWDAVRKDAAKGQLEAADWLAYSAALAALKPSPPTVVKALTDPSPQVRLVATQVAAQLALSEAAPALPALLRDRQVAVLQAAAQAAGTIRAKGALKALRGLAYHKSITVRFHAVRALGRLAENKAVGDLASAAGLRKSQAVMAEALLALGAMGAKAGLKPARKARTKSSFVLRTAARWALDRLAGKPATPKDPSLCGLLEAQKQACAKESPAGDVDLDLAAHCHAGEIPRLEPLVRARRCQDFQAGLQKLAKVSGSDLYTTWWGANRAQKREEVRYQAGVRQGPIQRWHPNGKLQARGLLVAGRRQGRWEAFFENGRRQLRARFASGRRHGAWARWFENGAQREKGAYRNGLPHGRFTAWYEGGQKSLELAYRDGKLEGIQRSFHGTGKPSGEAVYVKGHRHGPWKTWYPSGTPRSLGQYVDGQRHGAWTWTYPSGKPRETGRFERGQKTGTWSAWDEQGALIEKCEYTGAAAPRCQ